MLGLWRAIGFIVVSFAVRLYHLLSHFYNRKMFHCDFRAGPDSQQLPTAHTCFNTLIVPDYGDDYEKLSHRLGRAIIECEGFGLQ